MIASLDDSALQAQPPARLQSHQAPAGYVAAILQISSRHPFLVVQQLPVVKASVGLKQVRCAILANFQQAVSKPRTLLVPHPIQAFAKSFGDCGSHTFAR
jgi:hypothetical protein